ncbi:MAG: tetratricopeptide repeat protein, partial [Anaerolineae bacterium]|nr:tetratricopeptide repeat protein [Anaerolineae bacterium]
MTTPETEGYLQQGIAALKAGQREKAQELLTTAVTLDEENEQAWLWLSGALTADEDKRVCLE